MGQAVEKTVPHLFIPKYLYLQQEEKASYKSEYRNGKVLAMSGGEFKS